MPARITVVGSANMDLVLCAHRIPVPGETLTGRSLRYVPGGKGANQAVAAARLGAESRIVARVGDDPFGPTLRRNFQDAGVGVDHLFDTPDTPTGIAVIIVDDNGQNTIVLAAGANGVLSPDDVKNSRGALRNADYVLLQNEVPLESTLRAASLAKSLGRKTLWNPAPAPEAVPSELARAVDIIIPNETEASSLTGIPVEDEGGARRAAKALNEKGVGTVVITLGPRGALWVRSDKAFLCPAFEVDVVDTTAAGDTFCGALTVALAEGGKPEDAVRFACGAAALAVTKLGAQAGIPTRAELEAFLAER